MNPLLLVIAPTLISEIGQGVRQHLEHKRQQRAVQDQAYRIAALEAQVAELAVSRSEKK